MVNFNDLTGGPAAIAPFNAPKTNPVPGVAVPNDFPKVGTPTPAPGGQPAAVREGTPCDPNNPPNLSGVQCPPGKFPKCRDDSKSVGCKWEWVKDAAQQALAEGRSPLVDRGQGSSSASGGGDYSFNTLYNMDKGRTDDLYSRLTKIMNGSETAFTPEVMEGLDMDAKQQQGVADLASRQAINEDAASRGLGQSSVPTTGISQAMTEHAATAGGQMRNARMQKAVTDFQQKFDAIKEARELLDQLQQRALSLNQTAAQREATMAQLALGRENIAGAMDQLKTKIASDQYMQGQQLTSEEKMMLAQLLGQVGNY